MHRFVPVQDWYKRVPDVTYIFNDIARARVFECRLVTDAMLPRMHLDLGRGGVGVLNDKDARQDIARKRERPSAPLGVCEPVLDAEVPFLDGLHFSAAVQQCALSGLRQCTDDARLLMMLSFYARCMGPGARRRSASVHAVRVPPANAPDTIKPIVNEEYRLQSRDSYNCINFVCRMYHEAARSLAMGASSFGRELCITRLDDMTLDIRIPLLTDRLAPFLSKIYIFFYTKILILKN